MKKFGSLIRKRREEKGISLRAFAKTVEVTAAYVSMMERGMNEPPGADTIKRMAVALDLDADEMLAIAKKTDPDVTSFLREETGMPAVLRKAREQNVSSEELQKALDSVLAKRKRKGGEP